MAVNGLNAIFAAVVVIDGRCTQSQCYASDRAAVPGADRVVLKCHKKRIFFPPAEVTAVDFK